MSTSTPWRPNNRLLDDLPADVCARLSPHMREVELLPGKVLYEANANQANMYFPRAGIICLLYDMSNGASGAIAMVGNEGMIGTAVMLDSQSTPNRAVVQAPGMALSLKSEVVTAEFRRGNAFQQVLLRYVQAQIAQMAQIAICNRHHPIEKQVCRWLLLSADKLHSLEFDMTQEAIANMLGVRREGVTEAASRLQQAGLISYSRGHIRIVDHQGLEQRACECHAAIEAEYERIMARPLPE